MKLNWLPFSLAQANNKEGPDWIAWHNEDSKNLGLLAVRAVEASRKQGNLMFRRMHMGLLKAYHEYKMDLSNPDTIQETAKLAGLDTDRLAADTAMIDIRIVLGESHIKAYETYGVFGVPTFVLDDGTSAFVKTFLPPENEELPMFESSNQRFKEILEFILGK